MIKYTTEELRNLTENELLDLTEGIEERIHEFSNEELLAILKNMENKYKDISIEVDRVEDTLEVIRSEESHDYELLPQQLEAIKDAFEAFDLQDWERCRFALDTFFEYAYPEAVNLLDPSSWSKKHIMRWLTMLSATNLNEGSGDSPARIFFAKLSKRIGHISFQ